MELKEHIHFLDETVVSASESQVSSDVGGELAILNFQTGVYHGLDEVGVRIWELVQSPTPVRQLREAIVAEYDVDEMTCDQDIKELLQELADADLIEVTHGQAV